MANQPASTGEASLTVNNEIHGGWTDISVTRSMEQLAHTFDLGFTERWSEDSKPIPIHAGDRCTVKLDNKVVITGYVDEDPIDYDANEHKLRVTGRSLTADLIDCSAIYQKGQWKKQDLQAIAENLCQPFDIPVNIETDIGDSFRYFSLHDGESVYEALERACRMRGVLMMTNADGELVFANIGARTSSTVIEYGVNVIRGARTGGFSERFSKYIVKAQTVGDDDTNGTSASTPSITVTDSAISRYRPLIVQSECLSAGAGLQKRATWERNVRAGRSRRLQYTLDGWNDDAGNLWEPNTLVAVKDPRLEVDATLLITSVRLTRDADGTNTTLELCDPKAMTVEPLVIHQKAAKTSPFFTGDA